MLHYRAFAGNLKGVAGRFTASGRRNVWPSAMSRQMGGGVKAYILTTGQPATEIVLIFDPDPKPDGSSVAEQEAYSQGWLESLR